MIGMNAKKIGLIILLLLLFFSVITLPVFSQEKEGEKKALALARANSSWMGCLMAGRKS